MPAALLHLLLLNCLSAPDFGFLHSSSTGGKSRCQSHCSVESVNPSNRSSSWMNLSYSCLYPQLGLGIFYLHHGDPVARGWFLISYKASSPHRLFDSTGSLLITLQGWTRMRRPWCVARPETTCLREFEQVALSWASPVKWRWCSSCSPVPAPTLISPQEFGGYRLGPPHLVFHGSGDLNLGLHICTSKRSSTWILSTAP